MFHNYLITALRNFTRHKLYTFINIVGLTIGLTCAIFIILFVRDELSYDRWIPGTKNLYRVEGTYLVPGQKPNISSFVPFPVPDAMLAQLPDVKSVVHLTFNQMTVANGDRQFLDRVDIVSPNFFQTIQLPLVAGDRSRLLAEPDSIVISESAAKKYFGNKPALGQTLKVGGVCEWGDPTIPGCVMRGASMMVTGVIRDLPHNTQLTGDLFFSNISNADPMSQAVKASWVYLDGMGYAVLQRNANPAEVEAKLPAFIDRNFDPRKAEGLSLKGSQALRLHLTPFPDAHLTTDQYGSLTPAGSWTTVYGFIAIGVLILLIACFNFTNLATARAMVRAREISLRKVVGARRGQLVLQFLGESVLMASLSLIVTLALVELLLPSFDAMLGKPITLSYPHDWPLVLVFLGMAVLVGLLGGLYPALVLSRFRPASALRASQAGQSGSGILRTALVVMQFAVSIGLGVAALVVFAQISYARTIDFGLNRDGVVVVVAAGLPSSAQQSLYRALSADSHLKGAAISGDVPFSGGGDVETIEVPGTPGTSRLTYEAVGPNFFSLYDVHLLSGRALSDSHGQDIWRADALSANVLINRSFAEHYGFTPQSALGKNFFRVVHNGIKQRVRLTIVGVTADFMFKGDRREVAPTFYGYDPDASPLISVRVPAGGISEALSDIDQTWHQFAPAIAVNRIFMDRMFEQQFRADEQQGRIFGLFVGIAIFIAALGLFGLAAFSTERRTKEIGLRKTFGAKTWDIILLLLWQFSIPVLIANLIAWPVAYYYLHGWLESYAYRIALNPLYFIGAGLAALVIAWATVIVHAARVARANPVHALRYE
ncbi:MAG TPA: FtsX-like permease family protein [Rhizomicrobium sp.]|jgi:putative ABC transport system permease protein|nr:FtsX-like permease family protein [Rhizomicrobium sp.]